ncbi:YaaR family protein [Mesobacillus foraminis]|uniref:YaaR family protein n=1 Tax=Mesobacillus foraminis TaxID=279826 RepID=UPI001BE92E38|nr:YaaR family protein [Mesobacillus foraminis]MBT2759385.1 YaaR family protein [Mesobacillus foraminis]
MKIHQDPHLKLDQVRQELKQTAAGGVRFHEVVQKQEHKMQMGQLQQLLEQIDAAGSRLARSRSFKDMAKFKTLVRQFVKEAVEFGMDLKQSHSWNQYGEGRSLKVVETIDDRLVELAEELRAKKEQPLDLLGKIGEIKGLLINLYM